MGKQFINFNGNIIPSDQQIFPVSNRSFRYGDGLFESMRYMNGVLNSRIFTLTGFKRE